MGHRMKSSNISNPYQSGKPYKITCVEGKHLLRERMKTYLHAEKTSNNSQEINKRLVRINGGIKQKKKQNQYIIFYTKY